jgi:hypothetical protein
LVGFSIRQSRQCSTQILDNGARPAAQILDFSTTTTTQVFPITDFFTEFRDEADCGAVTCTLRTNHCALPYSQTLYSSAITIDSTTFTITLKRDVTAGWDTSICIRCASSTDSSEVTSWAVKQYKDCTTALTTKTAVHANPYVTTYDASSTTFDYASTYLDIFDNSE